MSLRIQVKQKQNAMRQGFNRADECYDALGLLSTGVQE